VGLALPASAGSSPSHTAVCGIVVRSNGHQSLDALARTSHQTLSQILTFTYGCDNGWTKGEAKYLDLGQLHRTVPAGVKWLLDPYNP